MEWSWSIFAISFVIMTIISMFSRGAMNRANVEKYGQGADYRANPKGAIVGSTLAGAIYAAIITLVVGFLM